MRNLFTVALIFSFLTAISQADTVKVKSVDSLVHIINSSGLPITTDTIINDVPGLGLYIKTFVSGTILDSDMVKFSNKVFGIDKSGPKPDTMNTLTVFYFQKGKLIKVEDSGISKGKSFSADWYYFNDQPLYYTLKNERAEDRAQLLLVMAKGMQDQFHKRMALMKK